MQLKCNMSFLKRNIPSAFGKKDIERKDEKERGKVHSLIVALIKSP